jgi:uncharacterized C2H2 Zn-finger protein
MTTTTPFVFANDSNTFMDPFKYSGHSIPVPEHDMIPEIVATDSMDQLNPCYMNLDTPTQMIPFNQDLFEDLVKENPQFEEFRNFLPLPPVPKIRSNSIHVDYDYTRPIAPRQRFMSAGNDFLGCGQNDPLLFGCDDVAGEDFQFPSSEHTLSADAFQFTIPDQFEFISPQDLESCSYAENAVSASPSDSTPIKLNINTNLSPSKPYPTPTSPPPSPKKPKTFSCSKCPKHFRKTKDYKRHLNSHEKIHQCHDCHRIFSRKDALTRHSKKLRCVVIKKLIKTGEFVV